MDQSRICAVVVTFRPPDEVLNNIASLGAQFRSIVIVDNGSPVSTLEWLRRASHERGFHLIENNENLGIASALNIGVGWAIAQGCEGVSLFDQDSTIGEGFLAAMLKQYDTFHQRENVAIIAPRHWDPHTERWLNPRVREDGTLAQAITSGSLMPASTFTVCGWFEDNFIIDMVDTEYCFRVRSLGFTIRLAPEAALVHSVGHLRYHTFLGIRTFRTSHHSAARRYYMTRNRIVTLFRYWKCERSLIREIPKSILIDTILIGLFEEERFRKFANTFRGIGDALLGKMGKMVDL